MSKAFQHDLAVCQRHAHYLARADTRLPARLTAGHLARREDDLIAALDQFVFRFMRLQDTMGARLLRGVLVAVLKEPFEDRPLRDVLDRLERFGVIPSADRWDEIRSMRDQLAHDYPPSEAEKAAAIELARGMAREMAAVLDRISQLVAPTGSPP